MLSTSQDQDQLPQVLAGGAIQTGTNSNPARKNIVNLSHQNHPLSHMIATSYGGTGFHQAHLAAANFNNTTHTYNISPNGTPMAIGNQP